MKKLIICLSLLILTAPSIGLAQSSESVMTPEEKEILQNCIADRKAQGYSTRQSEDLCTVKEVLPPIIKPSLLPGPTFGDGENRTGQAVTEYVTEKLLPKTASRLITIISVASLLGLMYAGIQFYMALGESEKMAQAKRAALYSVAGLVIAILSFSIVQIINLLPL